MSKVKIVIEWNGKRYRVAKTWKCESKRDCSLYEAGVCDVDGWAERLPCDEIQRAFGEAGTVCDRCYKEVKR